MIRRLRSRHRLLVSGLAVVAVPLFVAGLLARKVDEQPAPRRLEDHRVEIQLDSWERNWDGAALGSRLVWGPAADGGGEKALYWAIAEFRPLVGGDPLVYHVSGPVSVGDPLPGGALYLGALHSGDVFTAFAPPATRAGGTLFVFSLAQAEVLATHRVTP